MDNINPNSLFGGILAQYGIKPIKPTGTNYEQLKCDWYNALTGNLSGADCPKCKNRGDFEYVDENGDIHRKNCECMARRKSVWAAEDSGLANVIERYTFDKFIVSENWQAKAKRIAQVYAADDSNAWLYVAGQSGSGKTHLCTAVCAELMAKGKSVKYELWTNIRKKLETLRFDEQKLDEYLRKLNNAEILYIDDFLKCRSDKLAVNCDLAFPIINARYVDGKKTIISSELLLTELMANSEYTALARRIEERSERFKIQILKDEKRIYRKVNNEKS